LLRQALGDDAGFVRILDWDFEREPFFIESEYGGLNLFEWSETEEFAKLPLPGRVALAAEIVETVAAAHALGILHNDLKPANVLVVSDAADSDMGAGRRGSWQIKVADFGVASVSDLQRLVELQITHYGSFEEKTDGQNGATTPVGTAMYRAPELLAGGAPSIQGDVYALGVMLYQIVRGDFLETPSVGWEARIADPVLRQDIAAAANIDPARRIASASELAQRLRTLESRRTEMEVRAAEIAAAEQARRAMENARLRRPWLIFAMVALVIGLSASLWFYRSAIRQRDLAEARNQTLSAMNDFLTVDLLGQSNPLAGTGRPGQPQQETLMEAIDTALPKIDSRFAKAPATAGQLHESIAAALDARTEYAAADREFEIAAQRFREAEGPLSQNAMIAEYRREVVQVRSHNLAAKENAKLGFDHQENLVGNLKTIAPELQAWRALAQTVLLINGPHTQQAIPILSDAVHRAETTPGFDPSLLLTLKLHFCSVYLGLNDGADAERAAREAIATIQTIRGPDSPALLQPKLWLQESLFLQGKYKETLAEANADYPLFEKTLEPENLMTLASLEQRAGAEGQLGLYDTALRDELTLYAAAKSNSSGKYVEEETLSTIASLECRAGRFGDGLQHARQVVRESSAPETKQPIFVNLGKFAIAECLLSQEEAQPDRAAPTALREADDVLKGIDIPVVTQTAGLATFPGDFNVAEARLALLRGQIGVAKDFANKAAPIENKPGADPYEKKALAKIEASLASRTQDISRH
jgi:serine/threonine protein kinase